MANVIPIHVPRHGKPLRTLIEADAERLYRLPTPAAKPVAGTAEAGKPHRVRLPHLTPGGVKPLRVPGYFLSQRYKPEAVLGQGGRAAIYKAWDNVLSMHVVLKFLQEGPAQKPEAAEEIRREAVVTMRLTHENIVRLHNVEMIGKRLVLVMEYVDGENLRQILKRLGPLEPSTVLDIVHSCAGALSYAHKAGVVHRDLKPENIMISEAGQLKIVDFGTAVIERAPGEENYMEGTPGYMSPEQIRGGEPVDGRTDIFALGAVTVELLTGKRVFAYDGDMDHLLKADPRGLDTLPPSVGVVLRRALAPHREDRWPTAEAFYHALARAMEADRPPPEA